MCVGGMNGNTFQFYLHNGLGNAKCKRAEWGGLFYMLFNIKVVLFTLPFAFFCLVFVV